MRGVLVFGVVALTIVVAATDSSSCFQKHDLAEFFSDSKWVSERTGVKKTLQHSCGLSHNATTAFTAFVGPQVPSPARTILLSSGKSAKAVEDWMAENAPSALQHYTPLLVKRTLSRVLNLLEAISRVIMSNEIRTQDFAVRAATRQRISIRGRHGGGAGSFLNGGDDTIQVLVAPAGKTLQELFGVGVAARHCAQLMYDEPRVWQVSDCGASWKDPAAAVRELFQVLMDSLGLYERHDAIFHDDNGPNNMWIGAKPVCVLEQSAFGESLCVAVQCSSLRTCERLEPELHIEARVEYDTVWWGMWATYFILSALQPFIASSVILQLVLAAVCGVLVIISAVAYFAFMNVGNSRMGRIGFISTFAMGSTAILMKGIATNLWHFVLMEVRTSIYVQAAMVVSAIISTAICYRFLGPSLSSGLTLVIIALRIILVVVGAYHNVELTLMAGLSWLILRILSHLLPWLPKVFFFLPSGSGFGAPRDSFPRAVYEEKEYQRPICQGIAIGLSQKQKFAQYEKEGAIHTQRALDQLAAQIRQNPGLAQRLKNPNAVMHFGGVGIDDDE